LRQPVENPTSPTAGARPGSGQGWAVLVACQWPTIRVGRLRSTVRSSWSRGWSRVLVAATRHHAGRTDDSQVREPRRRHCGGTVAGDLRREAAMRYANLGNTGLRVSRVCLGMMSFGRHESRPWALDEDAAEPIVRRAVDGGVIVFDTADVYNGGQSEIVTGRLLGKLFGSREEYVVATKVHGRTMPGENGRGLSRKHVLASIDASLQRLGLDYVDLYQIHRWDSLTPIDETMDVLHDVVKTGKARYLGASSMYAWQFAKAQHAAATRFVSMQNHYNLIYREEEREMIPQCLDQHASLLPWSPLARGLLAGTGTASGQRRTTRANTDPFLHSLYRPDLDLPVIERTAEIAAERGVSTAQVALSWLLHKPAVTAPIVGATKLEHLNDALAAEQLPLTDEEITRLEEPYLPHPVSGIEL
jgi:aryl-alcohol dehydrogenase-like predicted oxidoreductase